jgi:Ca2+-binding RTX toxin-like protein
MPETPIILTSRLVVYEIASETGTLRLEVAGRYLVVDPDTGRVVSGTVSKITSLEYNGDISTGAGRVWDKVNLAAGDLSVLLGTPDWHVPQPASVGYYDMFASLPSTVVVSTFTEVANFVQGGSGIDALYGTIKGDVIMAGDAGDRVYGLTGLDELHGEAGNDSLYGGEDEDALHGDAGDDRLVGGAGFNTLYGGDGNDSLTNLDDGGNQDGGLGNDVLISGAGNDDQRGGAGTDYVAGGGGDDTIFGDADNDRLYGGSEADAMYGGFGDDQVFGGLGDDRLEGNGGADSLNAGDGNDMLYGGNSHDLLYGGNGDDMIYGETGNDTIVGGAGVDQFIFDPTATGAKTIGAFSGSDDKVIFAQFEGDLYSAYQYFLEHAVNVGRSVVFTDGDQSITFTRTQLSAFSLNNFGIIDDNGDGGGIGGEIIG